MPFYEFHCDRCDRASTESFRMADVPQGPRRCPRCRHKSYRRVFGTPYTKTSKTLKTFGQQAERNARDVGKDGMQFMERQYKRAKYAAKQKAGEEIARATGGKGKPMFRPPPPAGPEDASLVDHVRKTIGPSEATGDA